MKRSDLMRTAKALGLRRYSRLPIKKIAALVCLASNTNDRGIVLRVQSIVAYRKIFPCGLQEARETLEQYWDDANLSGHRDVLPAIVRPL